MVFLIQNGSTALHVAAHEGHLRVVEILLGANADVNIKENVMLVCDLLLVIDIVSCPIG